MRLHLKKNYYTILFKTIKKLFPKQNKYITKNIQDMEFFVEK